MRNLEKDAIEMAEKRKKMIETGFRLFAENTIEAISIRDVAAEAGIGSATVYRYFKDKPALVMAIAAEKWNEYYEEVEERYQELHVADMTAAKELEFYLDSFIRLYTDHGDFLRFVRSFNQYIQHEQPSEEQMRPFTEAVAAFERKFKVLYEKTTSDGTLRTGYTERFMFGASMHIMLAVVSRFADGLLYPPGADEDRMVEIQLVKKMILREFVN